MSSPKPNSGLATWRNDCAKGLKRLLLNLLRNWDDHTRIYERLEKLEAKLQNGGSDGGSESGSLPDMFADPNEGYKFNDTSLYAKAMVGYLQSRYGTIAEKYDDVTARYNGVDSSKNTIAVSALEAQYARVADSPNSGTQEKNSCGGMDNWYYLYHLTTANSTRRQVINGATQTPAFVRGDWANEFWKHTNPARQIAITDGYVEGAESTVGYNALDKTGVHSTIRSHGIYIVNSASYNDNKATMFVGGEKLFDGTTSDAYATVYCPNGVSVAVESSSGKILSVASSRRPMVGFVGKPAQRDAVIYLYEFESETAYKFVPKTQGEIIMVKHTYDQTSRTTQPDNTYIAWPNRDINYYSR